MRNGEMQTSLADLVVPRLGRCGDDPRQPRRSQRAVFWWTGFRAFAFAFAVLSLLGARADTITLSPIADTSLFEYSPNNNLGGLSSVPAGTIRVLKRSRA